MHPKSIILSLAVILSILATPILANALHNNARNQRDGYRLSHVKRLRMRGVNGKQCKARYAQSTSASPPIANSPSTSTAAPANNNNNNNNNPVAQVGAAAVNIVTNVIPAVVQNLAVPTSPNAGGKKGLGLNNPSWVSNKDFSGHINWIYNWSPWCDSSMFALGVECVPMFWGPKQTSDFYNNLPKYAGLGVKNLLFVNEPDQAGQSNLSPEAAAGLWWSTFAPLKNKFGLVGPALTSSPGCIKWQQQFMSMVGGAAPDYMALHWYGTRAQDMINYLEEFHAAFPNYSIWVTEWACQNFSGQGGPCTDLPGFLAVMLPYLNNTPWIARYAYFGYLIDMAGVDNANQLVQPNGSGFNSLGWQYATN